MLKFYLCLLWLWSAEILGKLAKFSSQLNFLKNWTAIVNGYSRSGLKSNIFLWELQLATKKEFAVLVIIVASTIENEYQFYGRYILDKIYIQFSPAKKIK